MKFVIGLGNPGLEYKATKHNVGFNVVKEIAKKNDIDIDRGLFSSFIGKGKIAGEAVMLVLPQTYMNLSGKAVGELFRKEAAGVADILVICDDINLKLGRIRIKPKGSAGGHKGLQSIIDVLGRDDFARLRVGIATDIHKGDITNYVLSPFKRPQHKNVLHAISLARDAAVCWITRGPEETMKKFNTKSSGTS